MTISDTLELEHAFLVKALDDLHLLRYWYYIHVF